MTSRNKVHWPKALFFTLAGLIVVLFPIVLNGFTQTQRSAQTKDGQRLWKSKKPTWIPPLTPQRQSRIDRKVSLRICDVDGHRIPDATIVSGDDLKYSSDATGVVLLPLSLQKSNIKVTKDGYIGGTYALEVNIRTLVLFRSKILTLRGYNQFNEEIPGFTARVFFPIPGLKEGESPPLSLDVSGRPIEITTWDHSKGFAITCRTGSPMNVPETGKPPVLSFPSPEESGYLPLSINDYTGHGPRKVPPPFRCRFSQAATTVGLALGEIYYAALKVYGGKDLSFQAKPFFLLRKKDVFFDPRVLPVLWRLYEKLKPKHDIQFLDIILPRNRNVISESIIYSALGEGPEPISWSANFRPFRKGFFYDEVQFSGKPASASIRLEGLYSSKGVRYPDSFTNALIETAKLQLYCLDHPSFTVRPFKKVGDTFRVPPGRYRMGSSDPVVYQSLESRPFRIDARQNDTVRISPRFKKDWDLRFISIHVREDRGRFKGGQLKCVRYHRGLSVPARIMNDPTNGVSFFLPSGKYGLKLTSKDRRDVIRKEFVVTEGIRQRIEIQ